MNRQSRFAVMLFGALVVAGFFLGGHGVLFINGIALLIVTCGTFGAICLSYPWEDLQAALQVTLNLYRNPPPNSEDVINILLHTAVRSRDKGILALENVGNQCTISFLKRALGLLVDGLGDEEVNSILHSEMFYFKQRRLQFERMFRQAALFAPAFGVAGSVVGLIDMLAGITDPDIILRTIPLALTAPLYGIVLANAVFFPIAEGIHTKTQKELLIHKLITDGVRIIRQEQNPQRLAIKLESFLTPAARAHENRSLEEIRERLRNLRGKTMPWQEPRVARADSY
jgi:chemotaxis protein MotA